MYNFYLNIKIYFFSLFLKRSTKNNCAKILEKNNYKYYVGLDTTRKKQFITRVILFLNNIKFSSEEGFQLDIQKKVQVAAAFAQISFGLNFFWLTYFKEVCIVSQSYSYKHTEDLYDGDVNLITKRINMSWPAIEQGFKITDDALNLCIHELGHAIYFENLKRPSNDKYFFNHELKEWKELALEKMDKIDANENIVLRDYAGANLMEFFSVSLETFFERPEHFKENEPDLFNCMVHMFNQNPLNTKDPINLKV